jgi:4'-phosphopantetheinyl transferase
MVMEVWWSSLTAANHGLLGLLDDTERARVDSLRRPADRGRSMLGAALLRVAAAPRLGIDPAEVVVDRTCPACGGPHGAPRIVHAGAPGPWVSVSHSGLLVVVALSTHGPVGVDVQRIADLPDPTMGQAWVRREARFKAQAVVPEQASPAATRSADLPEGGAVRDLEAPLDGYLAALAVLAGADAAHRVRVRDPAPDFAFWSSGTST